MVCCTVALDVKLFENSASLGHQTQEISFEIVKGYIDFSIFVEIVALSLYFVVADVFFRCIHNDIKIIINIRIIHKHCREEQDK
jgi:hypothetical protein